MLSFRARALLKSQERNYHSSSITMFQVSPILALTNYTLQYAPKVDVAFDKELHVLER
jgi:hypothetical protein